MTIALIILALLVILFLPLITGGAILSGRLKDKYFRQKNKYYHDDDEYL